MWKWQLAQGKDVETLGWTRAYWEPGSRLFTGSDEVLERVEECASLNEVVITLGHPLEREVKKV